ncbi:MAG: hypothetical protein HS128_23300 [Ideonella sp.]|nr:hypothetical protein [Ideonella sp.]
MDEPIPTPPAEPPASPPDAPVPPEPAKRLSDCVNVDDQAGIITIHGIRYAAALFETLAIGPIGQTFVIVSRGDGTVCLENRGLGGE